MANSNLYDDYVWRLTSDYPAFDVQLPQDLEWTDEFTWSPVLQTVTTTLTGALVIQESVQKKGRPFTLQGKDDMGWIKRSKAVELMRMRDTPALTLKLQYVEWNGTDYGTVLFEYHVMFRHYEAPVLELESALRFDDFEPNNWYKVRNLKFMEATAGASSPCSANVTLTLNASAGIIGTFNIGQIVTGEDSSTSGTVLVYVEPILQLFVETGSFQSGEAIIGVSGSAIVV